MKSLRGILHKNCAMCKKKRLKQNELQRLRSRSWDQLIFLKQHEFLIKKSKLKTIINSNKNFIQTHPFMSHYNYQKSQNSWKKIKTMTKFRNFLKNRSRNRRTLIEFRRFQPTRPIYHATIMKLWIKSQIYHSPFSTYHHKTFESRFRNSKIRSR